MPAVRFLVHVMGADYGLPYGHWGWYDFWSGIAGSFLVNMAAFGLLWYLHHTCQDSAWCWRWGAYPAAGGMFRVCRHHHPDLLGLKPRREHIRAFHQDWLRRTCT
jgi:hypothetical protein